ncbi:MAG: hypothetical protein UHS49_00035 [Faecalimonas sp.]|nr:hypothetical protein [Faecalimonas sp.]
MKSVTKRMLAAFLSFAMVVSTILPMQVASAADPTVATVYIKSSGKDDTGEGTKEKPYKTIDRAITALNAMTADEKVIRVIGSVTWNRESAPVAHSQMITITGDDDTGRLNFKGNMWHQGGALKFENIILNYSNNMNGESYGYYSFGNKLVFGEGVIVRYRTKDVPGQYAATVNDFKFSLGASAVAGYTSNTGGVAHELELGSGTFHTVFLGDQQIDGANEHTIPGVNFTMSGGHVYQIKVGGDGANKVNKYTGNVNMTFSGGTIDNAVALSGIGLNKLNFNGNALQVICNNGYQPKFSVDPLYTITAETVAGLNGTYYRLNCYKETGSALAMTATTGEYRVIGEKPAVAVNDANPDITFTSENGILKVTEPGTYTVSWEGAETDPNAEVYVSATGSDTNDGSKEAPFASIKKAIETLETSFAPKKQIKIIGSYTMVRDEIVSHKDMVTITGADENAELSLEKRTGENDANKLIKGGPVTIENIVLHFGEGTQNGIYAYGNELVIGGGVVLEASDGTIPASVATIWARLGAGGYCQGSTQTTKPASLTLNSGEFYDVYLGNEAIQSNATLAGVNYTMNGGRANMIYVGANGAGKNVYSDNVNITFNNFAMKDFPPNLLFAGANASAIPNKVDLGGNAVQIILNNGLSIKEGQIPVNAENVAKANGTLYYIKASNVASNGTVLEPTADEGIYKVVGEMVAIATNDADPGKVYESVDGLLNVTEPGTYTVTWRSAVVEDPDSVPTKMIKLDLSAAAQSKTFHQTAVLEHGKRYVLSVQVSNFLEAVDANTIQLQIRGVRSGYYGLTLKDLKGTQTKSDKNTNTYSFEFTWTGETGQTPYGIGFTFPNATEGTVYIADMQLREKGTTNNVLGNAGNKNTLLGWGDEYANAGGKHIVSDLEQTSFENGYVATLVDYDAAVFAGTGGVEEKTDISMIQIDTKALTGDKIFQQLVDLEQGKSYRLSFCASELADNLKSGDIQLLVRAKDDASIAMDLGAAGYKSSDAKTGAYVYEFKWEKESGSYGIGFTFPTNKAYTMYLKDMKLCELGTTTDLLPNAGHPNSLVGYGSEDPASAITEEYNALFEQKAGEDTLYTAMVVDYNAARFEAKIKHGMIHIVGNGGEKPNSPVNETLFVQKMQLKKGETYTISYRYRFEQGALNSGLLIKVKGNPAGSIERPNGDYRTHLTSWTDGHFKTVKDTDTCTMTHSFTWDKDTDTYLVGFAVYGNIDFYFADFKVSAASAPDVNLCPAPTTGDDMDLVGWQADWPAAKEGERTFSFIGGKNEGFKSYVATLMEYDEKIFTPKQYDPTMLYIDAGQDKYPGTPAFGQNLTLEQGETYTISYKAKYVTGELDSSFNLRIKDALGSGKYKSYVSSNSSGDKGFEVKKDKEKLTESYTFTWKQPTGTYAVVFQFIGKTQMYLTDFSVVNVKAPNKNLCPAAEAPDSLVGWRSDWKQPESGAVSFISEDKNNQYTVKLSAYDASVFVPDPILPNKMVYIESYGTYRQWTQRVPVKAGKTYRFSMCISSAVPMPGMVVHTGGRKNVFNNMKPINDPDYTKDWYEEVFEFTLPEMVNGEPLSSEVFVGVNLPAGTVAYIFNPKLWDVSDPTQENLYKNPGYNKGMDNWALSWGAWFIAGQQGLGVNELEKEGEFKLQVMDYDESKFVRYTDDSRFNDGEWWKKEDVGAKDKERSSTIKGQLVNGDDVGLEDIDLLLVSKSESFEVTTDKDGKFKFGKLPAGFYQLYLIENGEQIQTSFASSIKDGYVMDVKLVYNNGEVSLASQVPWAIIAGIGVPLVLAGGGAIAVVVVSKKRKLKVAE